MREIKFRAWGETEGEMTYSGDWEGLRHLARHMQYSDGSLHIMQYTGLHDKNGKEIYEGDVVKNEFGECGVVEWVGGGFCSKYFPPWSWDIMQPFDGIMESQTVIGNRYENPELLK